MEWGKYQSLSKELKEEYNFRFHRKSIGFNTTYTLILLIVYVLIVMSGAFIFFFVFTTPELEPAKESAVLVWRNIVLVSKWGLYLIIPMLVWNYCVRIYEGWKYMRWLRKNKIGVLPNWMVKMFGSKK